MRKAHATEGVLEGHALYGVRSFKVMSPQMRTVLESCAVAAKGGDARDQYFAVAVGSFDPAAGAQLRSELPGLEAADAALAAAVTELAEVAPDAHACKKKGVAFSKKGKSREGSSRRLLGAAELAEQKAICLMRLSRRFCLPDTSCKNKFVEMSAGFLVLAPGGTTQAKFWSWFLKKLCHPRNPRQVSLRKGMLRYNGITVSFVKLNSLALGLRQLAFNVC